MIKPVTISKSKPLAPSVDSEGLFKEGIKLIGQYSGEVWTDYNLHDPGITLLEYLCFGITDVGYRCSFPITDLLYARGNGSFKPVDNAFFPLHKILPCAPLTLDDYRRLILDHMAGEINNAWIEPANETQKGYEGLYIIRLQLQHHEEAATKSDAKRKERLEEKVRLLLAANRNLCESVHSVIILEPEFLQVEATISLNTDASAEQVMADIIYQLDHFLTPRPPMRDVETLQAAGVNIADMLDGPAPKHGFVETARLQPPPSVNTALLRDVAANVPGVRSIEQFRLKLNTVSFDTEIKAGKNGYICLSNEIKDTKKGLLRMQRNGVPVQPDHVIVQQILKTYDARAYRGIQAEASFEKTILVSDKYRADIEAYYSIQRHFPAVYGIGAQGLPHDADFMRQAQARQLKGFTALFELLLAGYLKQLTHLSDLFSIKEQPEGDEATKTVYFTQFPFDIPNIGPLLGTGAPTDGYTPPRTAAHFEADPEAVFRAGINQQLAQLAAIGDQALDRQNAFLDHLLARFGETFNTDLLKQFLPHTHDLTAFKKQLIAVKSRILRHYDTLSLSRGRGFNHRNPYQITQTQAALEAPWSSDNVSGLKKRICMALNLPEWKDHRTTAFLPEGFELKQEKGDVTADQQPIRLPLRALLQYGKGRENYEIRRKTGPEACWEAYFLKKGGSEVLVLSAPDQKQAEARLEKFIESLQQWDKQSQNFFLVEHILLRPRRTLGAKLIAEIPLEDGKIHLESPSFFPTEVLEQIERDFLVIGSNRLLYEETATDEGFAIGLRYEDKEILRSTNTFPTEAAAKKTGNALAKLLRETLESAPQRSRQWIEQKPEHFEGLEVNTDFYPNRLSVVAPSWASVFIAPESRAAFQALLTEHLPAHIHADFYWLNWDAMKHFETEYLQWLYQRSRPMTETKLADIDKHAIAVINAIVKNKT